MKQALRALLSEVYAENQVADLVERIDARVRAMPPRDERGSTWSAADILLISYADAIQGEQGAPLVHLRAFLREHLSGLVSHVHLLPFFPFTSDDGFAVSDYRALDPCNGGWSDVKGLSEDVSLVFDLVINHASSAHPYFQQFLSDTAPGNRYFYTADPDQDVTQVTRPRASPLLQAYETSVGTRWVWCTFSRDQVDWDFSNPDVLYEFVDVFLTYVERGASWMRLDAIAYLWKEIGTSCIHRPQTHAIVKLLRVVAQEVGPDIKLLTETNVPLAENLSYLGNGDEAHVVYNFSLPPLLLHALLTTNSRHLTAWCQSLPVLSDGCTYLNFTASHDGIGLRPAEGILDDQEIEELVACVKGFGGLATQRQKPDGSLSPYELNIALFDALQGTVDGKDAWQLERFLLSQGVMMALAGVPALYYNSFLAASNDLEGFEKTGRNRTLNRKKWTTVELEQRLSEPDGVPQQVLLGLRQMLQVRVAQAAFDPDALQECMDVDPRVVVLIRRCRRETQRLLCLFNLSNEDVVVERTDLGLHAHALLHAHYTQGKIHVGETQCSLSPYSIHWLEIR